MIPSTWVIPLGKGSHHNDIELMFMLRGLHTHHPEASSVVIGEKPVWYKGHHIPFREDTTGCKENKIRLKVLHAASLFPEFVFSNDDHFLLKPFSGENYCQETLRFFDQLYFGGPYKKVINKTAKITGMDFPYFDVHTPIIINSDLFLKYCSGEWDYHCSYLLKSFYAFHAGLTGTPFRDVKIDVPLDTSEIKNKINGHNIFTTDEKGVTSHLIRFWHQCYPVKSPWE